jgi:hypothetical protein
MPRPGDSRPAGGSSWVSRVRAREHAVPPTVKTDETPTNDDVRTAPPTAKTDETPGDEGITSVLGSDSRGM